MERDKKMRQIITDHIAQQYGVEPEFPWDSTPEAAVFRHQDNRKWFALIMNVRRETLGFEGKEVIPVINLKIDDIFLREMILSEDGIIPAYHMNKRHWVTVLLDGSVPAERVFELIGVSYEATSRKRRKKKDREPKEWIIPANPKYYDVIGAFGKSDVIDWKQGSGINTGDTVYLYVAAPVSAILYKCRVLETDIPYDYEDSNLTIKALMKIKLLKKYKEDEFTFDILRDEYGVTAIRGPRGIPNSLSSALR